MSMLLNLVAVSADEIDQLIADPDLAMGLIFPEDPSARLSEDIDKSWHGIHYLLTGTAWEGAPPLNALVTGGEALPDPDEQWGYGPPRYVRPADLAAFANALDDVPDETLRARFNPAEMMEKGIYPEIWDRDPAEDDALGYLMEYVSPLRTFVRAAADQGLGILVVLT